MRVILLSSSILPNQAAHPIQILNTVRALAALPEVEGVEVWFFGVREEETSIWRRYGLEPPGGVRLRAMLPGPLLEWFGGRGRLNPSRRWVHRWAYGRILSSMRRAAAAGPAVIVTRNESMLELLEADAGRLGIPLVMELHWLKSVDGFRAWLKKTEEKGGRSPALSEAKAKLGELRAKERSALRKADGVLCLTEGLRRVVERWELDRPLDTLPSGVDVPRFSPQAGDRSLQTPPMSSYPSHQSHKSHKSHPTHPAPPTDVLYVGQLYAWKGVDTLVRAMSYAPGATLTLVGGNDAGDVARVRQVAQEAGVAERLRFAGQVPHDQVPELVRRARVCVLPLPRAGFIEARLFTSPLKLFEYAAAGCAIVASDLPSVREAVTHGESAWLVRPDDARALGEGLAQVLSDEELRETLAAGARAVAAKHDYSRRAQRLLEFCRGILLTKRIATS